MIYLRKAIELAKKSVSNAGYGPFGAVVVLDGRMIGQGMNQVVATNDPTAHAEIVAIRDACRQLQTFNLKGCTLYTSCEPCPMCLAAIYWARIERVIYAATRQDAAHAGFDDDFFYQEMALPPEERTILMEQNLQDEAREVFARWLETSDRVHY